MRNTVGKKKGKNIINPIENKKYIIKKKKFPTNHKRTFQMLHKITVCVYVCICVCNVCDVRVYIY